MAPDGYLGSKLIDVDSVQMILVHSFPDIYNQPFERFAAIKHPFSNTLFLGRLKAINSCVNLLTFYLIEKQKENSIKQGDFKLLT